MAEPLPEHPDFLWRNPEPKASYDVVIVGAGGHGLAAAYYLAKNHGLTNIAVLERGWLAGGNMARNTAIIRSNYLWDESSAMFEAFGVDRNAPNAKFTGSESLDEVVSSGTMALDEGKMGKLSARTADATMGAGGDDLHADKAKKADSKPMPAKKPAPVEAKAPMAEPAQTRMPQGKFDMDGDLGNAAYWYRRANKPRTVVALDAEWEEIARALLA